jgi:anthranilate phosphoribosyltransferase
MVWSQILRRLAERDGAGLAQSEAHGLLAAALDGGIPELELGAALALLQSAPLAPPALLGFAAALAPRCQRLRPPPARARPVVIASHHGAREQPNLLPLLALALQRLGVPVLVHGALNGAGRIASAYILRELGVMPCASLAQAQARLDAARLAFVPTAVLSPGLAALLALQARLGFGAVGHTAARLLDPFGGESLLVIAVDGERERARLRECLLAGGANALLLDATEGEAFADPRRRPELELCRGGERERLFEAEAAPLRNLALLPRAVDAAGTAAWIRRALAGEVPLPLPLVNQIACCLYGAGHTRDLNQAKAVVAVEAGSLIAA